MAISTTAPNITFVLNDAGETKALLPVMQQLSKGKVSYAVLASGTSQQLLPDQPSVVYFDPEKDRFVKNSVALQQAVQAPVAVVGLSSAKQSFWAEWFHLNGSKVFAYQDNVGQTFLPSHLKPNLTALISPTYHNVNQEIPVIAGGQPALESFKTSVAKHDPQKLKTQLGIPLSQKMVAWAGGYGKNYATAFEAFLKQLALNPEVQAIVVLHPGHDGQAEKTLMRQYPQARCKVVDLPMPAATAIADIVAMHDSTVGVQAWLCGKSVLGFGQPDQPDVLMGKPGFQRVKGTVDFNADWAHTPHKLEDLNMPSHAAENIAGLLLNQLS